MSRLIPVHIDDYWDTILPGLQRVLDKVPGKWTLQQVYEFCRDGKAFLFLAREGFCVLRPLAGDVITLYVWIAYGQGSGLIHLYEPEIERLAREIGARRLLFISSRPGYRRVMRHWHRDGKQYTRYLS